MQHRMRRPINRAAPITDPTTIPAICLPLRPLLDELPPAPAPAAVFEAGGLLEDVELGNNGGIDENVGNCTPTHRLVTFDPIQQESVAFGELDAQ